MGNRIAMFLLGATLALGFAWSAYIISNAAVKVTQKDTIRVKGSASRALTSDFAIWSGQVIVKAKTLDAAYLQLAAHRKKAETFIQKAGFKPQEIRFDSISIQENYKLDEKGRRTNELLDYQLFQNVEVSSPRVYEIEKLSRAFTELVKEGVVVRAYSPVFLVQKLDEYKMALLAEATRNGRERAEILARNCGGTVGRLLSASQGIFQVIAPGSSDISDMGTYDKTTIQKELKAVVTLEFRVE